MPLALSHWAQTKLVRAARGIYFYAIRNPRPRATRVLLFADDRYLSAPVIYLLARLVSSSTCFPGFVSSLAGCGICGRGCLHYGSSLVLPWPHLIISCSPFT